MERCEKDKSYNRYLEGQSDTEGNSCFDMYEFFEKNGKENGLLLNALNQNSMGGPLTVPLKCGQDTEIKTPYSEKLFST